MVMVDEVAESTTIRERTVEVADLCVCVVCGHEGWREGGYKGHFSIFDGQ